MEGGHPEKKGDKFNSVNIMDEDVESQEERESLKKGIEKERKIAFNAYNLLKMEVDYIGDFFFGKKKEKEKAGEKSKGGSSKDLDKGGSEEEADDEEEKDEEEEEDYTLSKFYQSNTREELQNQLKNINFEEEENDAEEEQEKKKEDLLSGSDEEKSSPKKQEAKGRTFYRGETKRNHQN